MTPLWISYVIIWTKLRVSLTIKQSGSPPTDGGAVQSIMWIIHCISYNTFHDFIGLLLACLDHIFSKLNGFLWKRRTYHQCCSTLNYMFILRNIFISLIVLEISCLEKQIVTPFWLQLSLKTVCFILFRLLHAFVQQGILILRIGELLGWASLKETTAIIRNYIQPQILF